MRDWTREEIEGLAAADRQTAIAGCLEALDIEDEEVVRAAAEVLRRLDPLPELSALLSRDPRRALLAVMVLKEARLADAVRRLAVSAPDPATRGSAVRALSQLGLADREPILIAALSDPVPGVRCYAASGLGVVGTPSAIAAVKAAFQKEKDSTTRVFLVDVLDRHGALL